VRLKSYVKGCVTQFRVNLVRTMLTLLGVVFGVASVIAMLTIGEGAQRQIMANIEAMGATLVHVVPAEVDPARVARLVEASRGLSQQDVRTLMGTLPPAEASVACCARVNLRVTDLPVQATEFDVWAVNEVFRAALGLDVVKGRDFGANDFATAAPVALVSRTYAERFFGSPAAAVGRFVRLDYRWFRVVGVVAMPAAAQSAAGEDDGGALPVKIREFGDALFVTLAAAHERLRPAPVYGSLDRIIVCCKSLYTTSVVKDVVERVLAVTHGDARDYVVVSPQELMEQQRAAQSIFNVVLLSIAAISLLVGGIGIMNVMLSNVLERRKEIGIRRALGAKRRHIVLQFLFEAVVVCLVGGLLGVGLGVGLSMAILHYTKIPIAFSATPIVASFLIALAVGLMFGIVPARRAAGLDPITALHHE